MVKAKIFKYAKPFEGVPTAANFNLVEEELPTLKDGEFLAEAVYLTVDPYMRVYGKKLPIGATFLGQQVARITESRHPNFPVGKLVVGVYGWRTHTVSDGLLAKGDIVKTKPYLLPDIGNLPASLALGILGMPGNTAYFGLLDILKPKAGETVVVSGAAGATGSLVGQIARIKGAKVIGIAGSDEKGKWLLNELGFDHFINYKTANIAKELKKSAPNGVDCYFDNVGGDITNIVVDNMNPYGRIAISGVISAYNDKNANDGISTMELLNRELKVEGFIVNRWVDRWMEGITQILKWVQEGKIQYRETVTEGFENMPNAFIDMLRGGNVGKAIVKV